MKTIENLVSGYEVADARAAFYYLSRYLKQANYFEEYEKDYFEDDLQSVPLEKVRDLTFSMIEIIELQAGKKAADFSMEEWVEWMEIIDKIESNLDPLPSNKVIESAESVIEELIVPKRT